MVFFMQPDRQRIYRIRISMIDEFLACICYESYLMRNGTRTKLFLAKDCIYIALFLKIKISVFHAKNGEFYVSLG